MVLCGIRINMLLVWGTELVSRFLGNVVLRGDVNGNKLGRGMAASWDLGYVTTSSVVPDRLSQRFLNRIIAGVVGHCGCLLRFTPTATGGYKGLGSDVYWKIGLALHDVDAAATLVGTQSGHQFLDIG